MSTVKRPFENSVGMLKDEIFPNKQVIAQLSSNKRVVWNNRRRHSCY